MGHMESKESALLLLLLKCLHMESKESAFLLLLLKCFLRYQENLLTNATSIFKWHLQSKSPIIYPPIVFKRMTIIT